MRDTESDRERQGAIVRDTDRDSERYRETVSNRERQGEIVRDTEIVREREKRQVKREGRGSLCRGGQCDLCPPSCQPEAFRGFKKTTAATATTTTTTTTAAKSQCQTFKSLLHNSSPSRCPSAVEMLA